MAKRSETIVGLEKNAGLTVIEDQADVQTVAESDLEKVAASEAFMHEDVTVHLWPSTDPMAPPYAVLSVNGVTRPVPRGVDVKLQRKFVEVLARMKETRITQDMRPNSEGEITTDTLRGHTGMVYPFTVVEDKSPKGKAWLSNILAERAA